MKRNAQIGALAALAFLVACGDTATKFVPPEPVEEEELPISIPPSDAEGLEPEPLKAPFNLPSYAPLRDGATIEVSQATAPSGAPGGLVTFVVATAPRALGDFYKERLRREFGAVSDASNGPSRQLSGSRGEERTEISLAPAENGTRVTISYVLPTAPADETAVKH